MTSEMMYEEAIFEFMIPAIGRHLYAYTISLFTGPYEGETSPSPLPNATPQLVQLLW